MTRYKVTVVAPGDRHARPVLVVPFEPSALVTVFIDELFKRIGRLDLPLKADTHVATLHLNSETGAILDCEDLLSDVVGDDEKDKLFMVLKENHQTAQTAAQPSTTPAPPQGTDGDLRIRVVTPARARQPFDQTASHYINISSTATIRQLHQDIAAHLNVQVSAEDVDLNECNCKLAAKIADEPQTANRVTVIHGKSEVQHLAITTPTETAIKQVLRTSLDVDVETRKKVVFVGGDRNVAVPGLFTGLPVVAVCAKHRHTPAHARADADESPYSRTKVLDLHTSESPLSPACYDTSVTASGLMDLAENGVLTIFAVLRNRSGTTTIATGKRAMFRARGHWEPEVKQSDRGIAMFLSSLRVTVSLIQDMKDDQNAQDAILHAIDLLTDFPPAVRAWYVIMQGSTLSAVECAALAHAMFELLGSFLPTSLLGTNRSRLFEGSRLLFGFLLESAKTLKLPANDATLPYLSSFETVDVRDRVSLEPVLHAVHTDKGLTERSLFQALQQDGPLADSQMQDFPLQVSGAAIQSRLALLSGGLAGEVLAFCSSKLSAMYTYSDGGVLEAALDPNELSELEHLAELCGRNKLAVHRPSQLTSSITPWLTFDRNGHLAVYLGEQGCGMPGRSSLLFRPQHGEDTVDTAVIEQLIAPILQRYQAEGTAVLDALGGAAVRRLQQPDEILFIAVDCSASMRRNTDFQGVNDSDPPPSQESRAASLVAGRHYTGLTFDDLKERLCQYEGFPDMVGIVVETAVVHRTAVVTKILTILRGIISSEIVQKSNELEKIRSRVYYQFSARALISDIEGELNRQKDLFAALKTHETAFGDFLMYRALVDSHSAQKRWYWSLGDPVPVTAPAQQIPTLPDGITDIPDNLRCPISHTLMEDAVTSIDEFNYARSALVQWYDIRKSSPMTGLPLQDTTMNTNTDVCEEAAAWILGEDLLADIGGSPTPSAEQPKSKRLRSLDCLEITFDSRVGSFTRKIPTSMSLYSLYQLVFRGLKARHSVFQLWSARCGTLSATSAILVSSTRIENGHHITVRIADDEPFPISQMSNASSSSDECLVKVFTSKDNLLFGFWTKKSSTTLTFASVLWKYWRWTFKESYGFPYICDKEVWTDMEDSGDGLLVGWRRPSSERLTKYLTLTHCFGKLASEKVYREIGATSSDPGPLVLKVKIETQRPSKATGSTLSRLDVLKSMFEALINRMIAYNYKTHISLVTVASHATVAQPPSHVIENFRKACNEMNANGDTALWDALALARDQLLDYAQKYPAAKKRILVISDGQDSCSLTNTASDICWRLREAGIVVDTVALGDENNQDLRTISHLLGGYILQPKSLVNALAMCELEPLLSLTERPDVTPPSDTPRARIPFMSNFWNARYAARTTKCTEDRVPPIKKHPNLDDDFVELTTVASRPTTVDSSGSVRGRLRTSRLMNEMKSIATNQAERKYDVYVSENDFSFWKIVMEGPEGTPYSAGAFMLYMHAEDSYPTFAPKARFITKIRHPNVNPNGRICHSIFDRDWTSDTSLTTILDTVFGLLLQPEHSDPVNTTITLGYHHDEVEFADEVREHVQRHALKTREEWRAQLLGEAEEGEEEDNTDEYDEEYDSHEDD